MSPEDAEVPFTPVVEDLARLARTDGGAERISGCKELIKLVVSSLRRSDLLPGHWVSLTEAALELEARQARERALALLVKLKQEGQTLHGCARLITSESSYDAFALAAAGELLGLSDDVQFAQLLQGWGEWIEKPYEQLAEHHGGLVKGRQLRAGLWLGGQSNSKAKNAQPKLLLIFATSLAHLLTEGEMRVELLRGVPQSGSEATTVLIGNDKLSPNEAMELISSLLPAEQESDLFQLVWHLGCERGLIKDAAQFLNSKKLPSAELSRLLAHDPTLALDVVNPKGEVSIVSTFNRTLIELERENPRSVEALKLLSVVHYRNVPLEYVMSYLLGVQFIKTDELTHGVLLLDMAMGPLERRGIVKRAAFHFWMNPLEQAVWRHVFVNDLPATAERVDRLEVDGDTEEAMAQAGWGPYTIADRAVCNKVLQIYQRDISQDDGHLLRQGKLAGFEWNSLIQALRQHNLSRIAVGWYLHGAIAQLKGVPSDFGVGTHVLQVAEMRIWNDDFGHLMSPDLPDRQTESAAASSGDTIRLAAENFAEFFEVLYNPEIETVLGTYDIRTIDPRWPVFYAEEIRDKFEEVLRGGEGSA